MPISIANVIESFQLGLTLPPPTEELPETSSEQSATEFAKHFLMTRLRQLRCLAMRQMVAKDCQNGFPEKVIAIVSKDPSNRTPSEVSFLSNTYEVLKDKIRSYSKMEYDMYYGTKIELESEELENQLMEDLQGKSSEDDYEKLLEFLRYCSRLKKETDSDKIFIERIDYYTVLITKLCTSLGDNHSRTRYSRDDSRLEERRIIKEYVDVYLPGPVLCSRY